MHCRPCTTAGRILRISPPSPRRLRSAEAHLLEALCPACRAALSAFPICDPRHVSLVSTLACTCPNRQQGSAHTSTTLIDEARSVCLNQPCRFDRLADHVAAGFFVSSSPRVRLPSPITTRLCSRGRFEARQHIAPGAAQRLGSPGSEPVLMPADRRSAIAAASS